MGESVDDRVFVVTKKRQALRYSSFAEGVLGNIAEKARCSKAIVLKAVRLAYKLLKDHNFIVYDDNDVSIEGLSGWGKDLVVDICQKLKDEIPQELILQAALANVLNGIYSTHIHRNLYEEQIDRLNRVSLDLERSERKITEAEREISSLTHRAEVAEHKAEQAERVIEGLKRLITARTYAMLKEEEALLKEFVGEQVGQIVDPIVFKRNP